MSHTDVRYRFEEISPGALLYYSYESQSPLLHYSYESQGALLHYSYESERCPTALLQDYTLARAHRVQGQSQDNKPPLVALY